MTNDKGREPSATRRPRNPTLWSAAAVLATLVATWLWWDTDVTMPTLWVVSLALWAVLGSVQVVRLYRFNKREGS